MDTLIAIQGNTIINITTIITSSLSTTTTTIITIIIIIIRKIVNADFIEFIGEKLDASQDEDEKQVLSDIKNIVTEKLRYPLYHYYYYYYFIIIILE
jgi:hypothetical protein